MIPAYGILSQDQIERVHQATVRVLSRVGVRVYHDPVLERLADAGAAVDRDSQTVKIDENLLMDSLEKAGKSYILYGRDVGHKGHHLSHPHTVAHFREEHWLPTMWERRDWDAWLPDGGKAMVERAADRVQEILDTHQPEPIDEALAREVDNIVESARRHLL
jgi:trimethylamine:corrinoid methyltransferase-like protein